MWANSVWGCFGTSLALVLARIAMIWTSGYEWIGPVLLWSAGAFAVAGSVVLVWPLFSKSGKPSMVPANNTNISTGKQSDVYNVTNQGSGNAFGRVDNLYFAPPKFELTDEILSNIASQLDPKKPVALAWVNTGRTPNMIVRLEAFLKLKGFTIGGKIKTQDSFNLESPVTISSDGIEMYGGKMCAGAQVVILDVTTG